MEEERSQFTFYGSFAESVQRIKKKTDRCDAYDAIVNYALSGVFPDLDALSDAAAIAFLGARPNIDASRRKAKNGRAGGKRTGSKPEANAKQTVREKEGEKEKEVENECSLPPNPLAAALTAYQEKINPMPSGLVTERLTEYLSELDLAVILHAIDIAHDNRKATWNYLQGILRRYKAEGLTDIGAVLAEEQERERRKEARDGTDDGNNSTSRKSWNLPSAIDE